MRISVDNLEKGEEEMSVREMYKDQGHQTKRKLIVYKKKKRGVSVADACCHGNWGQWMVAMALSAWNSGKGYFVVCVCVCKLSHKQSCATS